MVEYSVKKNKNYHKRTCLTIYQKCDPTKTVISPRATITTVASQQTSFTTEFGGITNDNHSNSNADNSIVPRRRKRKRIIEDTSIEKDHHSKHQDYSKAASQSDIPSPKHIRVTIPPSQDEKVSDQETNDTSTVSREEYQWTDLPSQIVLSILDYIQYEMEHDPVEEEVKERLSRECRRCLRPRKIYFISSKFIANHFGRFSSNEQDDPTEWHFLWRSIKLKSMVSLFNLEVFSLICYHVKRLKLRIADQWSGLICLLRPNISRLSIKIENSYSATVVNRNCLIPDFFKILGNRANKHEIHHLNLNRVALYEHDFSYLFKYCRINTLCVKGTSSMFHAMKSDLPRVKRLKCFIDNPIDEGDATELFQRDRRIEYLEILRQYEEDNTIPSLVRNPSFAINGVEQMRNLTHLFMKDYIFNSQMIDVVNQCSSLKVLSIGLEVPIDLSPEALLHFETIYLPMSEIDLKPSSSAKESDPVETHSHSPLYKLISDNRTVEELVITVDQLLTQDVEFYSGYLHRKRRENKSCLRHFILQYGSTDLTSSPVGDDKLLTIQTKQI